MSTEASLLPCATCPWRVDKDASTIPRYNHEKACRLTNSVGPDDGLRTIMACHHSAEDNNVACNGYLAREGWSNINVRLLLARGQINNPTLVVEACEDAGIELHPNYTAVLAKLGGRNRKVK